MGQPEKQRIKKIHRDKWKWKHNSPKPLGCHKSGTKREYITIQVYLKKQEKSQQPKLTPKGARKRTTNQSMWYIAH